MGTKAECANLCVQKLVSFVLRLRTRPDTKICADAVSTLKDLQERAASDSASSVTLFRGGSKRGARDPPPLNSEQSNLPSE